MTTMTAGGRFEIGRVISHTFGAIGRNLPSFLLLTIVFYTLPQFLIQWGTRAIGLANPLAMFGIGAGALIAGVVFTYVLQAGLVSGTVAYLQGKPASLSKGLSIGFSLFLPLFGLSLMMGLLEALGFVALIVPGVMLMIRWCVAVPTLVAERNRGISGAMGRSADLTKGHRWSIFGLMLIFGILIWIVDAVAMALALGIHSGGNLFVPSAAAAISKSPVVIGTQVLFGSLVTLIGAVGAGALYYELRSAKEGVGVSELAAVFD